jgi:alkanesulfonate monooxygenase SsuD/methylene tetrahydromethanopterin reductase-like flavin-dependent oxidoreductase (luciferase family)
MKFFFFHLMPFADLDLDYDRKYNSAWVTLPNSYYDPVKGHRLYNRYIDELIYADELGFDGVGVNEHHQNAYGLMPTPGVIAGALARQTSRARIAVLGRALPLVNNPLTIAEEFAMLDNISGGRLIAGFVRGIGAEYHASGVNPADSHARYLEAHDLIIRAWTEIGPFPYEGKHYQFKYVNTWPRPYQQPHPPVWIPSQGSRETIEWAAHPARRYTYLQTFSPVDALARFMGLYCEQAHRYGYAATPEQLGWAVPIYVADSDQAAYIEAGPHIENFYNKFARMPQEMLLPPGYLSLSSMQSLIAKSKATLTSGVRQSIDDVMSKGMFLCGSADTVCGLLAEHQRRIGFGHLIAMLQFATLPPDLTRRNLELFARRVIPRLRHLGEGAVAGSVQ